MKLRETLVLCLILIFTALPQSAIAQDDASPRSIELIDDFGERAVNADYYDRNRAFDHLVDALGTGPRSEPATALAVIILETQLSMERTDAFLSGARSWLGQKTLQHEDYVQAAHNALVGYVSADPSTPPTGEQLYALAEALERIVAAGTSIEEMAGGIPSSSASSAICWMPLRLVSPLPTWRLATLRIARETCATCSHSRPA